NLQPERCDGVHDRTTAANGARRPVERSQEAVARRVDLPSAEPRELAAHGLVMRLEQVPPAPVAELARALGRADDVGEQNRGEHALRFRRLAHTGEELADLGEELVTVGPRDVILAGQLDVTRPRDSSRQVPRLLDVTHA